jgi:uncharacterized protein (DUF4415 family)
VIETCGVVTLYISQDTRAWDSNGIWLDEDVILIFEKKASKKVGYQSLVNAALQGYVHDHSIE